MVRVVASRQSVMWVIGSRRQMKSGGVHVNGKWWGEVVDARQ